MRGGYVAMAASRRIVDAVAFAAGRAPALALGLLFAPLVALWLCANFGLAYLGAYLLSGAISTLVALLIHHRIRQG